MVIKKRDTIFHELKEHFPFTFGASLMAGILVAVFYYFGSTPSKELFEIIHGSHILVSATATSAIYWKYKKSAWRSILIGMSGAILIGSFSDVLLPFLSGRIFSLETTFHLPFLESPILILGLGLFGAIVGMYHDLFNSSHAIHVFLSIFASLFYLLAFSVTMSTWGIILISILVFFSVYIPCCISDIVFPILFLEKPCIKCQHWH